MAKIGSAITAKKLVKFSSFRIQISTSNLDQQTDSSSRSKSSSDASTLDTRVEISRQMLERNLERLIVQQGMDAISQLTYVMTPEQIEKLIIRTEQVSCATMFRLI